MKYGLWYINGGFFEILAGALVYPEIKNCVDSLGKFSTDDINIAYRCLEYIEKWASTQPNISKWRWEIREKS